MSEQEWIRWPGGAQPVADDVLVEVRFFGEVTLKDWAGNLDWQRLEGVGVGNIIAYRVIQPIEPAP